MYRMAFREKTYDKPEVMVVAATVHWRIIMGVCVSTGMMGLIVVNPTRISWRNVLYLLIWVGVTCADGNEKSQNRPNVLGSGKDWYRKYRAESDRSTSLPMMTAARGKGNKCL